MIVSVSPWDPTNAARDFGSRHDWDIAFLAGIQLPGVSRVKASRGRHVDTRLLLGQNASKTFLAYRPAKVSIQTLLWTNEHLRDIESVLLAVEPLVAERVTVKNSMTGAIDQKRKPQPCDAYHPALRLRGIRQLYIMEIEGPEHQGKGLYQVTFHAEEWWPLTTTGLGAAFTPVGAPSPAIGGPLAVAPPMSPSHEPAIKTPKRP